MKTLFILTWLFFVCQYSLPVYSQQPSEKKKKETIAVLDFKVTEGLNKGESSTLTNKFRSALSKTQAYDVLERSEMETILKEQDMSMSDMCDAAECAVQVGKLLVANKMVVGEVGKIGQTYSLTVRIIDVSSGKVEISENQSYKGAVEGLLEVFDVLAQKITGTYKKKSYALYYVGGALVAGGAAAAVLLGGKKGSGSVFPNPPLPPAQ